MKNPSAPKKIHNQNLLPWRTIWFQPRATIRFAVKNQTMNLAIFLAILSGIVIAFDWIIPQQIASSTDLSSIFIIVSLIGVMIGLITWFLGAAFLLRIGKVLQGKANFPDMLIATSISLIPIASGVIICILDIIILGDALFKPDTLSISQSIWLIISRAISILLLLWSTCILVIAISEVHRFSTWKSVSTFAIPAILIMCVIIFLLFW